MKINLKKALGFGIFLFVVNIVLFTANVGGLVYFERDRASVFHASHLQIANGFISHDSLCLNGIWFPLYGISVALPLDLAFEPYSRGAEQWSHEYPNAWAVVRQRDRILVYWAEERRGHTTLFMTALKPGDIETMEAAATPFFFLALPHARYSVHQFQSRALGLQWLNSRGYWEKEGVVYAKDRVAGSWMQNGGVVTAQVYKKND